MKPFALVVALLFLGISASAENALENAGRSPDSHYEVRVFREPNADPSDYAIRICTAVTGKPFFTLADIGGYLRYPAAVERCRAWWHASSLFVAVTDEDTRHSTKLCVLAVHPDHAERLALPDYIQNALGRVNAASVDSACVSTPKGWDGDDLILSLYFTANKRRSYTCEVILHLSHSENSAPSLSLKSVSSPRKQDG